MKAFHPAQYAPLYLGCGCWIIKGKSGDLWDAMENSTTPEAVKYHITHCGKEKKNAEASSAPHSA